MKFKILNAEKDHQNTVEVALWKFLDGSVSVMMNGRIIINFHEDGTFNRTRFGPVEGFQCDDEGRIREI